MKTRLLRPEENWKSNLTMAVAFEGDYDLEKAKESAARERTEEEKREDARNRCFGTFLDDDETICGVVNSREYLCRFDGGTYKLGGVGGVSTLPQFRRGGAEGQAHVGTRVPVRHREYIEFIDLLLFRV